MEKVYTQTHIILKPNIEAMGCVSFGKMKGVEVENQFWKILDLTVLLRTNGTPRFLDLHFGCFDHLSERILTQMISRLKALTYSN